MYLTEVRQHLSRLSFKWLHFATYFTSRPRSPLASGMVSLHTQGLCWYFSFMVLLILCTIVMAPLKFLISTGTPQNYKTWPDSVALGSQTICLWPLDHPLFSTSWNTIVPLSTAPQGELLTGASTGQVMVIGRDGWGWLHCLFAIIDICKYILQ